jgi:hypothetical protein
VIDLLPPCGKAVAYYEVEDAHGEVKVIRPFNNYESMRHRIDEIKNGKLRSGECETQQGVNDNAIKN